MDLAKSDLFKVLEDAFKGESIVMKSEDRSELAEETIFTFPNDK